MFAAFDAPVLTRRQSNPFARSSAAGSMRNSTFLAVTAADVVKLAAAVARVPTVVVARSCDAMIGAAAMALAPVPATAEHCSGVNCTVAALPWLT